MIQMVRKPIWIAFRSTPPRGGDARTMRTTAACSGFDPRPREGATHPERAFYVFGPVSIHAPARGRRLKGQLERIANVFRSTPPRGGDLGFRSFCPALACFDPRPREGATRRVLAGPASIRVSIHAPARGRRSRKGVWISMGLFRSTPPRGGDPRRVMIPTRQCMFRSTPPRGGDGRLQASRPPPRCFDPRPREGATFPTRPRRASTRFRSTPPRGGDKTKAETKADDFVSIHAPARGRRVRLRPAPCRVLFRSTPPRGGDPPRRSTPGLSRRSFDPRPREGATSSQSPGRHASKRFDPRPREGATVYA